VVPDTPTAVPHPPKGHYLSIGIYCSRCHFLGAKVKTGRACTMTVICKGLQPASADLIGHSGHTRFRAAMAHCRYAK
jgi:hypothetical protein